MPKKLTCKGTLRQMFYLSEAPYPILPPPYTLYTCIQVLIHTGKVGVGGGANQREGYAVKKGLPFFRPQPGCH
jgi:hypothetical protein